MGLLTCIKTEYTFSTCTPVLNVIKWLTSLRVLNHCLHGIYIVFTLYGNLASFSIETSDLCYDMLIGESLC